MSEIRRRKIYAGYYDRYNKCNTVKEKGEKVIFKGDRYDVQADMV